VTQVVEEFLCLGPPLCTPGDPKNRLLPSKICPPATKSAQLTLAKISQEDLTKGIGKSDALAKLGLFQSCFVPTKNGVEFSQIDRENKGVGIHDRPPLGLGFS